MGRASSFLCAVFKHSYEDAVEEFLIANTCSVA